MNYRFAAYFRSELDKLRPPEQSIRCRLMRSTTLTLINPLGLHARAASKLVDTTKGFASEIRLTKDSKEVDAKSIMAVLMLGAAVGSQLDLVVEGEDEEVAFGAVCELINAGFHELED